MDPEEEQALGDDILEAMDETILDEDEENPLSNLEQHFKSDDADEAETGTLIGGVDEDEIDDAELFGGVDDEDEGYNPLEGFDNDDWS